MTETGTRLTKADTKETATVSDGIAMLSMIERVALNPDIDINKFEKLMEMQERILARNARIAFAAALAAAQSELPVIPQRGRIIMRDKSDKNKIIQSTSYALWEDTNEIIKPVLAEHGFSLSFRTGMTAEGRVSVTAILLHAEGHQEETTMVLQHDSTGSKNAVQAIGSSTSYGKRYAASAILNLTSRGEDDDGGDAGKEATKGTSRDPYTEMQSELDACATLDELGRLWKSKQFQAELEKLPADWKRLIAERKEEIKRDRAPKNTKYVKPDFDNMGAG